MMKFTIQVNRQNCASINISVDTSKEDIKKMTLENENETKYTREI